MYEDHSSMAIKGNLKPSSHSFDTFVAEGGAPGVFLRAAADEGP